MSSSYSILYGRKENSGPFLTIEVSDDSPEFENWDFGDLSKENGEIIYLAEQDNVGFFHYEHWRGGTLLRRLKYNSDGFWLCGEGNAEEWELNTLFSPELMSRTLSSYDPEMHEQITRAWSKKGPEEGDMFPILEMTNIVSDLRKHWNLSDDTYV